MEQRDRLEGRLKNMLVVPRHDFLMTADERVLLQGIAQMESAEKQRGKADERMLQRLARLNGVITWGIDTEYDKRFTQATEHLRELDKHVEKLKIIYNAFIRARQAATLSYEGYSTQIDRLRIRIRDALSTVNTLMSRQGHMIEIMAINELEQRRRRLEEYQIKARFAMAESYDLATKERQEQKKGSQAE
jgi:chromosome segregation ATPase